jgi:hypothetical protein
LPAGGNRAVAQHLQNRAPSGAGRLAAGAVAGAGLARVADREGLRSNLADNRVERRTERQENLGNVADNIRNGLHEHYDDHHLFDEFWADHPHAHYHFHQNPAFWTWATWNTMAAFVPWNWGAPVYYDYGYGGNVYYEEDTVYIGDTPIPVATYDAAVTQLATNVPDVANPEQMEWLPLGVFAITKSGDPKAIPNMFLQLAVSKEGIIAGTYQNKTIGKTESVEGMVDKDNQRAAWTIVGKNMPIMEAGIANLTMNESSALMHFSNGQTQRWLMVRVEGPQEGQ